MISFNQTHTDPTNVSSHFIDNPKPITNLNSSADITASAGGQSMQGLISKGTLDIVFKANSVVIIFLVGLLGSVLNVVNSVVFIKQGLKDPVTITLFVLSIADLGSVATLWFRSVFFILLFFPDAVPNVDPSYLSGVFTWPHAVLVRVSCLLTVFIAFERWICITFPLQANRIITVPIAKGYNFVVTVCLVATFISLCCYSRIELVFLPQENRSLFIIKLTMAGYRYAQQMSSIVTTVYLLSFGLLILFTFLIIIKLNRQTKWRQTMASASAPASSGNASSDQKTKMDAASAKTKKVVKMVTVICLIFIVSTIPSVVNTFVYMYLPGYVEFGRFYNLYQLNNQICFTFEVVNSTCNFFIYFYMSSNFANTLKRLIGKHTSDK